MAEQGPGTASIFGLPVGGMGVARLPAANSWATNGALRPVKAVGAGGAGGGSRTARGDLRASASVRARLHSLPELSGL